MTLTIYLSRDSLKTQGPRELYAYNPLLKWEFMRRGTTIPHWKSWNRLWSVRWGEKTVPAENMNDAIHTISNTTRLHHKNRIWLTGIRTKFDAPTKLIKRPMKVRETDRDSDYTQNCACVTFDLSCEPNKAFVSYQHFLAEISRL